MADFSHVELRRARIVAASAAGAVVAFQLVLSLVARAFKTTQEQQAVDTAVWIIGYPIPRADEYPPQRIIWVALTYAVTALAMYVLLTVTRRAVPVRQGGALVFVLGWGCAFLALGAATLLSAGAARAGWPSLELRPDTIAAILPWAGLWALAVGWVGGLAATLAYVLTSPSGRAPVPPATGRAFAAAGAAAGVFAVSLIVGGILGREGRRTSYGIADVMMFPQAASRTNAAQSYGALAFLVVIGAVALTLLYALALRRARSGVGAFLLGWGCVALVAGVVGLLRHLTFVGLQLVDDVKGNVELPFYELGDGTAFGLLTGWVAGLAGLAVVAWSTKTGRPAPEGASLPRSSLDVT